MKDGIKQDTCRVAGVSYRDRAEQYRIEAALKYREQISQELESMQSNGLFPYEGKWRTVEEITELQRLMRKKDRTIFLDLNILFLVLALCEVTLAVLLFSL